jgi:hypothetical protein
MNVNSFYDLISVLFLQATIFLYIDYIRGTAALCILALATDIFATFLAGK